MPQRPVGGGPNRGQIVVGLIILAMGGLLLIDRYVAPDVRLMRSWWPLMLIVMGAARLATVGGEGAPRSCRSGAWLVMIGVWGLIGDWRLFGFTDRTSWPLLVIGAGVMIVWRAVAADGRRPIGRER